MEKVIYTLSLARDPGGEPDLDQALTALPGPLTNALTRAGVHGVQVNVADADVAAAAGLRIALSPRPADIVVSAWVDSATDHLRQPIDQAIGAVLGEALGAVGRGAASTMGAYLVTESVPLANTHFPAGPGERTPGWSQLAFLCRPAELPVDRWLDLWLNQHTQVALDTQDTYLYVQNVVTRVLTPGASPWDAIVEEGFPAAAMADPQVFFDAVGDDDRLARHQQAMFASVQRFVDFTMIDVVPTSRYAG